MYSHGVAMLGDATVAQLNEERVAYQNVLNLNATVAQLERQGAQNTPAYADIILQRDIAKRKWAQVRARNQSLDSSTGITQRIGDVQTAVGSALDTAGSAVKTVADNIGWMLPLVAIAGLGIAAAIYLPKPSRSKGNA